MTGLAFTAERRSQLSAYLSDMDKLRAEYPAVADYLDVADRLTGTSDNQTDGAFDLRLMHFMTGGPSVSQNPYWDIVAPSVFEHEGRRVVNGGQAEGSSKLGFAQTVLQAAYAYAIPSPETVDWVCQFCDGRPIVELGAGRGYWAAQLAHAGQSVHAYELEPPEKGDNASFPKARGQDDVWYPVKALDSLSAESQSDHVLFLCWPPGWGDAMASEALAAFEESGGSRLVFIGETKGGKTGDDLFFDTLTTRWRLESSDSCFVSWWNLADVAQAWVRR